jgi:hypothetical protein
MQWRNPGSNAFRDALRRRRRGCYTHRLACRKANLLSFEVAANR